jgi:hypothetical protein
MKKEKEVKAPKYFEAPDVDKELKDILTNCSTVFSYFNHTDFKVVFKNAKSNGKKPVAIKIIKEPVTFTTAKRLLMVVTADWWQAEARTDRIKGIIEALTGIMKDDKGLYIKRDFDIQTYNELLKDAEYDFSKFATVLPGEAKPEELVLKG